MKIRMNTTKCGPITSENWNEGQIFNVSVAEARAYVENHLATALEPFEMAAVQPTEAAVSKAPEKAVLTAPEIAGKGNAGEVAFVPPVAAPASPVVASAPVGNLTKPPTWGTGVKK